MESINNLLLFFLITVPSAVIHEYSHGAVANALGDPTAKYAGRLTLNPLAHIDRWGTVLMPIFLYFLSGGTFMFAYAKPVPYNPYNLRYQRFGPSLVALAGPLSNLTVALICGLLVRGAFLAPLPLLQDAGSFLSVVVYINIALAIFNLVPIPPLDGSKILFALLPAHAYRLKIFLERYGLFLLFLFIFYAFQIIVPLILKIFTLFTGLSPLL